jgi:hypothetical protein
MTPEPSIFVQKRVETCLYGDFALWLAAIKAHIESSLAERHEAGQERDASHHEGCLWLAESAYTKAYKALVNKAEGLTPKLAEQSLMPGVFNALNDMLKPLGFILFHPRVVEKPYAQLKEESAETLRLNPSFIVPKSTSTCRALAYTIAPLPAMH